MIEESLSECLIDIRLTPEYISTNIGAFLTEHSHSHTGNNKCEFIAKLFNRLQGWTKKGQQSQSGEPWVIKNYVIGKEELDKYGRQTLLHYHVNIVLISEKTPKQLKSLTQEYLRSNGAKGNRAYMVRVNRDRDDEDRWFRYGMKQGNYMTDLADHEDLAKLAKDEYKNQVIKNLESEEQQRNKNQFRDKMYKHLDDNKIKGTKNIMTEIFHYYNKQGRDAPLQELSNKAMNYEILRQQRNLADIFKIDKNQLFYL